MNRRASAHLASTSQGRAFYCACKDRVGICFKDRWFDFGRTELPDFRETLMRLIGDPPLIRRLIVQAMEEAESRGLPSSSLPTVEDLGEMLGLIDAALLILEAQEIAWAAQA